LKIHLLAYCIMDNHYHLVLENNNERMSDFPGQLNGLYGMYYRKVEGGKGYVFQSRFKSTLIENDSYLIQSLLYLLLNPVRAGIVHGAEDYTWSSINEYFATQPLGIVDAAFVNELFGSREQMILTLGSIVNKEFERIKGAPISAIDTGTFKGKHQRCELLVLLKDKSGLKYREIAEFDIFGDLSFASLRSLYRNMKKKKRED